jgi:hypothetical protein
MSLTATDHDSEADGYPARSALRWRGMVRGLLAVLVVVVIAMAAAAVAASRVPEFYRQRIAAEGPDSPVVEQASRRLVSDISALHASFIREGSWEASFTETDVNAWLASDLPRNHRGMLPDVVSAPRLRFSPRRVRAGVRIGTGFASAVATLQVEIQLREPNQLGIVVEEARLGSLPLPKSLVLGEIRRRFDRLGMVTAVRRLDDRSVLVVYIPSTHESGGTSHWLERLAIGEGTMAFAGRTLAGRATLPTPRPADAEPVAAGP